MLLIHQDFKKTSATDGNIGNINIFLKRILIEVVVENYKQMLNEKLVIYDDEHNGDVKIDSPIRANENVVFGLFSNALAKVADRSRPEVLIKRPDSLNKTADLNERPNHLDDLEDAYISATKHNGYVDFLAWYDQRSIAIELKKATMDCVSLDVTKTLKTRWDTVVQQTKEAQNWLREKFSENKKIYPKPISVGLMVVVGRCAASRKDECAELEEFVGSLKQNLQNKPGFIATYELPRDFQLQRKFNSTSIEDNVHIPYVAFIAIAKTNKMRT